MVIFWFISSCSFLSFALSAEAPIQIHILFRHGERSPTSSYPTDPHRAYKWEGGAGQLTNRGKLQMYMLGQNIRAHYGDFLPQYYWSVDVNFTSSATERCLMSAELVGAGLFPPLKDQVWNPDLLWQPIPVHYLPRSIDNLLAMKSMCTEYDKEFIEVHQSAKVQKYNEEYKNLYDYLTEHTGKIVDDIEEVESLYNTLEIYLNNNLSLPYWVNDTLMAQMRIIGAQNLAIYSETDYMKRMKGGFFLKTVVDLMNAALDGVKTKIPSLNMYAAHDLTIVHVMRALNLIDVLKPDLGSVLTFELYKDREIKVFYWDSWKGNPIQEQFFQNCPSPCKVEEFQREYKNVLPIDWSQECQIKPY